MNIQYQVYSPQMILYIAEKPSLGRAIADALPRPHRKEDGCICTGDGNVVSWCVGHLLEQAEPEAYDPAFKRWSHDHLPIVPTVWQLREKKQTAKQLRVLRKLIRQADSLVHAGDPDREGQLLVDQVIHYLGGDPQTAQRLLISDLNRAAVTTALGQLRENRDFKALSTSALARSRADWLYGINLTRAYTLQGRKVNYGGVLSVGRVQTPVLGLVVRRDEEIEAFVSKPFFEVWANLETIPDPANSGEIPEQFRARWKPSEECARFLDADGRNLSRPLAENVARRITNTQGTITNVERKQRRARPSLPHSLSSLQIDAARAFHMSAQHVLDICQNLYEQHKLITYPRSDSRYLPQAHHAEAPGVVEAIRHNPGSSAHDLTDLNLKRRSSAWSDGRVDAHHAIIPTRRKVSNLTLDQTRIYGLVSRNYLAQFLPDHEYAETRVEVEISGGLFVVRAREELVAGWRRLFPARTKRQAADNRGRPNLAQLNHGDDQPDLTGAVPGGEPGGPDQQTLPLLKVGLIVNSLVADLVERKTSPPARFNDATLLVAMTGVATFVSDPELRKVLRDTDGLGTEATRAGIIELLFRRNFLARAGKHIESTPAGRGLIHVLPEAATLPDMTARWESILTAITERSATYDSLMIPLIAEVTGLVENSLQVVPRGLVGIAAPKYKRRKTGRAGSSKKATGRKRKTTTSGERTTGVRKSRTAQTNRATNRPTSRRSPRKPSS